MSATGTGDRRSSRAAAFATRRALTMGSVLVLAGCGAGNIPLGEPALQASAPAAAACVTGSLTGEGSSAQQDAVDRWRVMYQQNCKGATIGYQPTGSGQGIEAFLHGHADFAGSESPLSAEEQRSANDRCAAGPAIHLPMAAGSIAIAYRVPGVFNLHLTPASLAKIFNGSVTRWDDDVIRSDNPNATLPATPIRPVHRSDSSGTTDNFTAFLAAAAPADWTVARGRDWKAPGGAAARGTSEVARAVKEGHGTIGYVELSAAQDAALSVAAVENPSGEVVLPTAESTERTLRASRIRSDGHDIRLEIDYAGRSPAAYPIVQVTYEIVCQKGLDPAKAALVRSFLTYTASDTGQRELPARGYTRLPESLRPRVEAAAGSIA
jgi:phosphate transport system substrate-binding protein